VLAAFLAWTSSGKPISTLCAVTPASDRAARFWLFVGSTRPLAAWKTRPVRLIDYLPTGNNLSFIVLKPFRSRNKTPVPFLCPRSPRSVFSSPCGAELAGEGRCAQRRERGRRGGAEGEGFHVPPKPTTRSGRGLRARQSHQRKSIIKQSVMICNGLRLGCGGGVGWCFPFPFFPSWALGLGFPRRVYVFRGSP